MKKLCMGFILVLLVSISLAQDIPSSAQQWKLSVWINPPVSNSMAFVWIESSGKLSILGKKGVPDRIELDKKIDITSLDSIYTEASRAIKTFVVRQERIMSDKELSKIVDSTWSMGIELQVGNQRVTVDDFITKTLDDRPAFKALLILINKQLPEKYRITL